jgi:hypothetical protein
MRTFLSSQAYRVGVAPGPGRTIFRKNRATHACDACKHFPFKEPAMNNIVYIVGAVVIVIAILSFLGLS